MATTPHLDPAQLPADAIEVASVIDAWGVKGWLKLLPHSADPQALFNSRHWYLVPKADVRGAQAPGAQVEVLELREHSSLLVALLAGISDRASAQNLRGARIFLPRSGFPPPGKDEYYWVDLLGLQVLNREGMALGTVVAMHPTGPHSALVLDFPLGDGRTAQRMIPFVSAYVDSVSLQDRKIVVDWQPDY